MLAEVAGCETFANLPQAQGDRYALAARYFLDLVLLPPLMRALSGENVEDLRAETETRRPPESRFLPRRLQTWRHCLTPSPVRTSPASQHRPRGAGREP